MLWQLKGDSSRVDLPLAPDHGKVHTLPLPLVSSLHGARARLRRRGEDHYDTSHGEKDIRGRQVVGKANILSTNRVSIMHTPLNPAPSDQFGPAQGILDIQYFSFDFL